MQLALLALLGVTAAFPLRDGSTLLAGVAKINASVPIGVPLAGYNHGDRRVPHWPLPEKKAYTTFMTPSTGRIDPTWAKAVVIQDESGTKIAWGTFDGIGMDGGVAAKVFEIAAQKGLGVHPDNVILSGSHSHSGPGAVSTEKLWELAPATDLFVPEVQEQLATGLADALIEAEKNMKPAKIGTGIGNLPNATTNRRAKHSPYLHPWSIDPNLGVVSIDDAEGNIMATIWNFAIHGVCYGPDNMEASGDIMNGVCSHIESTVGGVALFVNADAGDVDPGPGMCDNKPQFKGAPIIGDAVVATRKTITPSSNVSLLAHSQTVDFGKTDMNLTLARMSNCTKGGFLDICGICEYLHCDANLHLSDKWVEEKLKFTALRLNIDGVTTGVVTMPGEALTELGSQIRGDAKAMGFDKVLLAGYSQNHAGYFCTPDEYDIGGYESQLSFWGEDTSSKVRNGANTVLSVVKP